MSDFLFRTFGGFRSQSETVVYPTVYYTFFGGVFFPKVMDPSRKPPELAPFWVTETESNASMDDGWMKLSAIDPHICVCVSFWVHVDIFQLQLPRGTTLRKVGWKVNIWILYRHGAISTGKWCLDHVVVTHPLGRSRMPVIRGHGSSNATGSSVQRNSAGNQSENCHHKCAKLPCPSKSHSSPCCSWLLNFEYQLYIDVIFPSVFHNFKISPQKIYAADIGGSTPTLICFKNQNHHHPPKPPQLALAPPVTRSSASSTSADSVRKCRFSETNSSPRWTQPWSLRNVWENPRWMGSSCRLPVVKVLLKIMNILSYYS